MLNQNWFQDKRFVMFEEYAESQSFFDTVTRNIYVIFEEYGRKGNTIIQEITPESLEYASKYARYKATFTKEYHVTLMCSEEYRIEAHSKEDAEAIAREKFGNNYLIDEVKIEETHHECIKN